LTCYYYNLDRVDIQRKEGIEFDLQFNKIYKGKEYTMNVKVFSIFDFIDNQPQFYFLEDIESLVEDLFQQQKFTYYDEY
jgi:hypothetical protein